MDKQSQENLQRILQIDASELTENDANFLRARRFYLTKSQKKDYESILGGEVMDKPRSIKEKTQYTGKGGQAVATQPLPPQNVPVQPQNPEQPVTNNGIQGAAGEAVEDADCLDPDCTNPEHNHQIQ